ncbi:MAG: pilin [Pseudomonadota bacterium]|nr:pilin [Pseudomonadota bacterium]
MRSTPGFTLLELMIVVAVIAILALLVLPTFPDKVVREQIVDAVKLADIAKAPVEAMWKTGARLPLDNGAAGLPVAEKIVNNYISSVTVESGAIQLTFGNQANAYIRGKTLTLRPGVVDDAPVVPVAWVCGNAEPPRRMTARGVNKTSVPAKFLPLNCRGGEKPASVG